MNLEPGKKESILIVDDDPTNLAVLFDYLQASNFEVFAAEDGQSAIKQARYAKPNLILLDIMMPGVDGFETCHRLKSYPETKDIPIIFLTAISRTQDKVRAFEAGAVDYITKPFQYEELLARITAHLTIHKLQQNLDEQNKQLQEEIIMRQRIQEALQESRERYRFLAEYSTDMISRQTLEGTYRYVSPACHTLLGYTVEEMIGHRVSDFLHPEDLNILTQSYETKLKQAQVATIVCRTRHKYEGYIWLETTHQTIYDPETVSPLEIIAVSRNITARKIAEEALQQAHDKLEQRVKQRTADLAEVNTSLKDEIAERKWVENALRKSEGKYRNIFEESKDVIFISTSTGQIIDINPACLQVFGYTKTEMIGVYAQNLYVNFDDRLTFWHQIKDQGSVRDLEIKFRRQDGTEIICLLTATLRQGGDGTILGYQGILRDITKYKQAEQKRLELLALQRELVIAHDIQQSLLPPPEPNWPDLDLVCYSAPAREVGGDFYSYYAFPATAASKSLKDDDGPMAVIKNNPQLAPSFAVVVGDVSGKGTPAALLMSVSLASLEAVIAQNLAPADLLLHLNSVISRYTETTHLNCALCYTEILPVANGGRLLRVGNAGCITPIIRRANGKIAWAEASGLPLGIDWIQQEYKIVNLNLAKGDLIVMTSDGVVEAKNATNQIFGFERLEQAVASGPTSNAKAMLDHLKAEVTAFGEQTEPHDDLTIVVVQV